MFVPTRTTFNVPRFVDLGQKASNGTMWVVCRAIVAAPAATAAVAIAAAPPPLPSLAAHNKARAHALESAGMIWHQ